MVDRIGTWSGSNDRMVQECRRVAVNGQRCALNAEYTANEQVIAAVKEAEKFACAALVYLMALMRPLEAKNRVILVIWT